MIKGTFISDPSSLFLKSGEKFFTYHDLYCHAARIQQIVNDPGEPIGIMTSNKEIAIMIIASAWINGLTVVPFPLSTTAAELTDLITLTGVQTMFCDSDNLDLPGDFGTRFVNINHFTPAIQPVEPARPDNDRLFGIFFTSGTSGKPKAVPLKRGQMISAARSSSFSNQLNPGDLWLHCLPLHHIGGISIILRSVIYGSGVYNVSGFDVAGIADILSSDHNVKAVSLVPTQLSRLIEYPGFKTHEAFRFALIGGGRVPDTLREKAAGHVPAIFSYGMTETCAQIVATRDDGASAEGSTGSVIPPNELIICDDRGKQLDNGQSGFICLRGPQVFDGYLNENENTFFTGGWFNTGDYGYTDNKGNLFVESRREDRIVTGGENVDPFEVENALLQIPGISDAAVIGLADDEWGQIVTAVIVTGPDFTCTLKSLRGVLKSQLVGYKIPRRLEIVNELPKSALGKVKKSNLKLRFE
ncbi:MAG: AMP-binding protein [Rhodothermaceae bacterium]|nr:AMP-binding protein [Rhodothermaceae bacterium]